MPACRGKTPLTHRVNSPLIQAGPQPLQYANLSDVAVGAHDDFQHNVPDETATAGFFRVIGFDFPYDGRRRDAAARTIRPATRPAARAGTDTRSFALTNARALTGAGAATST